MKHLQESRTSNPIQIHHVITSKIPRSKIQVPRSKIFLHGIMLKPYR